MSQPGTDREAMEKVTFTDIVDELDRQIAVMTSAYGRMARNNKIDPDLAAHRINCMKAVRCTMCRFYHGKDGRQDER